MKVDLRRLEHEPAELSGTIPVDDPLWVGTGFELAEPLTVQVTAEGSSAHGVWVRGSFLGRIRLYCRRCLEAVELEVTEELGLFFDPNSTANDEDWVLYALEPSAEELDLRGPLGERFILAAPTFALCRQGCKGLCPHCGVNRNDVTCECRVSEIDARWGPLQQLREAK